MTREKLRHLTISMLMWLGAAVFAAIGFTLVLVKILGPIDLESLIKVFQFRPVQETVHGVSEFVLFSRKDFGDFTVTTGVMFASNISQDIVEQWCYIRPKKNSGFVEKQLTLATIAAEGAPVIPRYSRSALREFGLTHNSHRALVKSHCRFRTGSPVKSSIPSKQLHKELAI